MSSIETVPPVIDAEEARRERNRKLERTGRWLLPLLIMTAAVFCGIASASGTRSRNTSCRAPVWCSTR
jgi:hypothetical protein